MKRILSVLLLCAMTVLSFASCTPAADIVEQTTEKPSGIIGITPEVGTQEFKDYVMHSENYALYLGEYYYFFSSYLTEFITQYTVAERLEMGFDDNLSLKEQSVKDGSVTWYDFFAEMTVNYMTEILTACEEASDISDLYAKAASEYANTVKQYLTQEAKENGYSFVEYIGALYGGNVQAQNYLNAIQMEYMYSLYVQDMYIEFYDTMTDEEIEAYVAQMKEEDKNSALSRNVAYILIDDGRDNAEKLHGEFVAGEKTLDAFRVLANDYECDVLENCAQSSVIEEDLKKWLFADGRAIGDCAVIDAENGGLYVVMYCADGKPMYYLDARNALAQADLEAWQESLKAKHTVKTDDEKIGSLNA